MSNNKDLLVRVHVPDALGGGFITLKPTEGSSFEALKVKSLEKLVAKGIKAADPKSAADFCLCILWNGEIKVNFQLSFSLLDDQMSFLPSRFSTKPSCSRMQICNKIPLQQASLSP